MSNDLKNLFFVVLILIFCSLSLGFLYVKLIKPADNTSYQNNIQIEDSPVAVPEFKRAYSVHLPDNRILKLTYYDTHNILGIEKEGELDQAGGIISDDRWVLFDPSNIADKILDPQLVPVIQQYVEQIEKIDNEFRKSNPMNLSTKLGRLGEE